MTIPVPLGALACVLAAEAGSPEGRPRIAAGATLAIAHLASASGEHDEVAALGVLASFRPRKHFGVHARASRAGVPHDYRQLRFDSAYYRISLAPEGRLPVGNKFDFLAWLGAELTLLRSSLRGANAAFSSSRFYAGPAFGGGGAYRLKRVELRADVAFGWREHTMDRAFQAALSWTWP